METYLKRKNEELKFLAEFIDDKFQYCPVATPSSVIKIKEQITKEIRNNNSIKYYHELTNKTRISFNDLFEYNYTYERFNGFIKIPLFANSFYNIDNEFLTETYFTNCGMSAIVALLSSVVSSNDFSIDLMYEETYFETIKFLSSIQKSANDNMFIYIDSIASNFNFDDKLNLNDYQAVIIDTTCFIGNEYKTFVEKIIKEKKPCILVRSHTKLDLLASEYSHIGSVSFIYPNIESEIIDIIRNMESDCKHLIGVLGACLPPEKFPTFLLDSRIKELNKARLKAINENNSLFVSILKDHSINAVLPNHRQFCLIYLNPISIKLDELKQIIYKFCNNYESKFLTYPAVSFGFDYISIDCYQNFTDLSYKIRVCINDLPKEIIDEFANDFIEFLQSYEM